MFAPYLRSFFYVGKELQQLAAAALFSPNPVALPPLKILYRRHGSAYLRARQGH